MNTPDLAFLAHLAPRSLEANLRTTAKGTYLAAGPRQFGSLWTRDFCFAAGGLLKIGRADIVRAQLERLIAARRNDGLIPRMLDSVPSRNRVLLKTLGRHIGEFDNYLRLREPLIPEYLGEHGTIAVDSNFLVLLTAFNLHSLDRDFVSTHRQELIEIYRFYDTHRSENLILQGPYEDWQDSATRSGFTFFVNLLNVVVLERAATLLPEIADTKALDSARTGIRTQFFDEAHGLFRSHASLPHVSLDANLLALSEGFIDPLTAEGRALYKALKAHPIWEIGPGVATVPDYPNSWISWTTKFVGLRHYHDRLVWSWLIALSARVAALMGDRAEAERLLLRLQHAARRDGMIAEVYQADSPSSELQLFESLFYKSEGPFSWGAGQCVEALVQMDLIR